MKQKKEPPMQLIKGLKIKLLSENKLVTEDVSNLTQISDLKKLFLEKIENSEL